MLKTLAWLVVGVVGGAVLVSWLQPAIVSFEAEPGASPSGVVGDLDLERELAVQDRRLAALERRIDELAAALDAATEEPTPEEDANVELAARIAVIESRLARLPPPMPSADGNAAVVVTATMPAVADAQAYANAAANAGVGSGEPANANTPGGAAGPTGNAPPGAALGVSRNAPAVAGVNAAPPSSRTREQETEARPSSGPPEAPRT